MSYILLTKEGLLEWNVIMNCLKRSISCANK